MTLRLLSLLITYLLVAAPTSQAKQGASTSFDSNGVQVHYVDRGQGQPVVLLHGLTGSYARHWGAPGVIDALEKAGYRVIAMDCRGHGLSGKPHAENQYGIEMVRDVVRLLDHLKVERAHVVGYSMGGAIANQLLVRHADRLRTVTLLGAGWEGEDLAAFKTQMLALADGFAKKDATVLLSLVTTAVPGQKQPTEEEIAAMNAALFGRNDAQALAAATRGLVTLFDVSAASLRSAIVPMLAIVGEQDTRNLEGVRRLATVVRGLEVVQLPGANHSTSVRPSAAPIVSFLNRHRR